MRIRSGWYYWVYRREMNVRGRKSKIRILGLISGFECGVGG